MTLARVLAAESPFITGRPPAKKPDQAVADQPGCCGSNVENQPRRAQRFHETKHEPIGRPATQAKRAQLSNQPQTHVPLPRLGACRARGGIAARCTDAHLVVRQSQVGKSHAGNLDDADDMG